MADADDLNDSERAQPVAASKPRRTPPAVVRGELAKTCCICGLDLTGQKRHRDGDGQYWCAPCHEFPAETDKSPGVTQCPSCGRSTRESLLVERAGERICHSCNEIHTAAAEHRRLRKAAITARPELAIRAVIRRLVKGLIAAAAVAVLLTLYHFGLLFVRPMSWVPFRLPLYMILLAAVAGGVAIGIQYARLAWDKHAREAGYDKIVRSAVNQILALDEDSSTMGISEPPEPLRRRVEDAVERVEACAAQGVKEADKIVESLAKNGNPTPLVDFLLAQRPNTTDTVARNREIAIVSYLKGDWATANSAISAILLRIQYDRDAMVRQALICFRTGKFDEAKKTFKRVVNIAKQKNSEIDLAAACSNLGMLNMMLNETKEATDRYRQALSIYKRLGREEGQADCLANLGLISFKATSTAEAETQLREAIAINKRGNRREGMAICCSLLGVILLQKSVSEFREAQSVLNRAAQLNLELGRMGGLATAYGNLGLLCAKRQDFKGARELLLKAQGIYQRINRPKMMAKIQEMLKTVGKMSEAKSDKS